MRISNSPCNNCRTRLDARAYEKKWNGVGGRGSILEADVLKQVRHALLVVNATNAFDEQSADVDGFDFVALHLLNVVGHGVGNHHFVDQRVFDEPRGFGRQNSVSREHVDLVGPAFV